MNSSLIYEILLYLHSFYLSLFAFCEFWIGIFKAVNLPYPTVTVISELLLLLFLSCTECIRILLGRNGNLTERSVVLLVSVGLTIPSICGVLYFLLWQTYVLRLEVVLCAIQLTLQGLELAAALLCLAKFYKSGTY
jgi:transmembrane protein 216